MREVTIKSLFMVGCSIVLGIVIALFVIDSMTFDNNYSNPSSDNNYNNSSSSSSNQENQAKSKFIKVLEENGYVKDSPTKYIRQSNNSGCNATEEIYFNSNMYSNVAICQDGAGYLENTADYYWDRELILGSAVSFYYYGNSKNIGSSYTYSLDAYNNFSCSGNSYDCEYIKTIIPMMKSNFNYLINEAEISLSDLN